jgi:hypothetical protein
MNKKEIQTSKMIPRVVAFGISILGLLPKDSAAAEILKTLGSCVEKSSEALAKHASAESAMREAHDARTTARTNARDLISRASMVSRASDNNKIRLPKTGSEHALIAIGRGIEKDAAALKEDFVRHALSLDEVIASTNALETAILDYTKAKTGRSAARIEWNEALTEAMHALIGLDAIVANALADDPVALASYQGVRTIAKTRGRSVTAKAPPVEAPSPPVQPAPPAASSSAAA